MLPGKPVEKGGYVLQWQFNKIQMTGMPGIYEEERNAAGEETGYAFMAEFYFWDEKSESDQGGSKGTNICMLPTNCLEGRTHCSKEFAPLSLRSVIALHEKKGDRGVQVPPSAHRVLAFSLSSHQNTSCKESGSLHGSVSTVGFPTANDKQMLGESVGSPWQALSRLRISESSSGGFLLKIF